MRVEIPDSICDKVQSLNSIDKEYFEYIEKSILENGLLKSFDDAIFNDCIKLLHDRNSHSYIDLKNYIHNLDNCFNFKSKSLDHFNNQNIIKAVSDDNEKLYKRIQDCLTQLSLCA